MNNSNLGQDIDFVFGEPKQYPYLFQLGSSVKAVRLTPLKAASLRAKGYRVYSAEFIEMVRVSFEER